jgi:nucleoside-diphosphate-sugar epimerase
MTLTFAQMSEPSSPETYLVTGAYGCIGVWVLRALLARGTRVVAYDLARSSPRLRLVLDDERDPLLLREHGDIADLAALERVMDNYRITSVIHLAALQAPFCRDSPPAGAAANVLGTANVFDAASRRPNLIPHVVYASSIAAYDAYVPGVALAMTGRPGTLYGVYKRTTEQMADFFAEEKGLSTIALRPHTVYGPARDQGFTAAPTLAMLAAAAGRAFVIPYTGRAQFQFAADVAEAFVLASRAPALGSQAVNLAGHLTSIDELVGEIGRVVPSSSGSITAIGGPLSFPESVPTDGLSKVLGGDVTETPLARGVEMTISMFRKAIAEGRLDLDRLLPQ